jgi:galactose mutarotase-like enzyme
MTTIRSDSIEATVASAGAELQSIKGRGGLEYLWQGDPAFWPRRSPLLFPIVGALPGGTYTHGGKAYAMGNHGFAKGREFRLASSAADRARFELASDAESRAVYPFDFSLAATFRAEANRLRVGWEVTNAGKERMPFSIGAHPAFRAPLEPGERREDYELVFEKAERVSRHFLNADNVLTGASAPLLDGRDRLRVESPLFVPGAIVLKDQVSRSLTLRSGKSGRYVRLDFPGFPYLGIWSPKDNERGTCPFVCVEPWYGVMPLASSGQELSSKEGCVFLEPGGTFSAEYSIEIG